MTTNALVWVIRSKYGHFIRKWGTPKRGLCKEFNEAQQWLERDGADEFLWRLKETLGTLPADNTWRLEGWEI